MEDIIKKAITDLTESNNPKLCEELIRIEGVKSPEFAKAALEAGIFYPAILYLNASEETRDQLIAALERDDVENPGKYLHALAMIGDDVVAEHFLKWENNPNPWRQKLYVGPLSYALEGGWCIEEGKKKQLFFPACYALERVSDCDPKDNVFGGVNTEKCQNCGSSYVNNLIVDGNDERLAFLGLNGRIKIQYCSCVYEFDCDFCKYEEDGESTFLYHQFDGKPWEARCEPDEMMTVDDEDLEQHPAFVLSKEPVSECYCDEFDRSAIGGRPAFINDAVYIVCPECGKTMRHLAQLGSDYTDSGTEYIQICTDCKIAAVVYQQT